MNEDMQVLLVEDNFDDAEYLRNRLRRSRIRTGLQVTHRETLAEGLEHLQGQSCDVVLLDLNLPDSRGVHTLDQLLNAFPDIPVIVVTGLRDDSLANQALEAGACDYITKGRIDADELMRMLRLAVKNGSGRGVEASPVERALAQAIRNMDTIPECGNCGKVKLDGEWMIIKPGERDRLQEHLSSRLCPQCLALLDS